MPPAQIRFAHGLEPGRKDKPMTALDNLHEKVEDAIAGAELAAEALVDAAERAVGAQE